MGSIGRILITSLIAVLVIGASYLSGVVARETPGIGRLGPGVTLEAREAAAIIVAFEHYRALLKKEGIDLTESEFVKLHHSIWLRTEEGQIHIYFHPPNQQTAGGGVQYVVDADRLKVIEQVGER